MVAQQKSRSTVHKVKAKVASKTVTKAGQNTVRSGLCIATSLSGMRCMKPADVKSVPYCKRCRDKGDPSFRVVQHPKCGKILIAARKIPKGYRAALWGRLFKLKDIKEKNLEWSFEMGQGTYLVDPCDEKGSLLQFCACPGPGEAAAVYSEPGRRWGDGFGSRSFTLPFGLKKSWQVTLQYGDNTHESEQFFKDRGIRRMDVGTTKYPALRRKDCSKK